jgi:hypothetical protein
MQAEGDVIRVPCGGERAGRLRGVLRRGASRTLKALYFVTGSRADPELEREIRHIVQSIRFD